MEMEVMWYWYVFSMILFFVEAFGLPGLGFLFAAISAFCVGVLVQAGVVGDDELLMQGATFFILTAVWGFILWKPLKKWRMQKPAQEHNDMVGRTASVTQEALVKGKAGHAKWSGTIMRARLASDAAMESAEVDTELRIVNVDSSTLILAELDYKIEEKE